jgi:hypothetical protein
MMLGDILALTTPPQILLSKEMGFAAKIWQKINFIFPTGLATPN